MIADAMTFNSGGEGCTESLWNEEDGFYYDAIDWGNGNVQQLPVRSLVGLMPLYATLTLEPGVIHRFPGFKKRMDWFLKNRSDISLRNIANMAAPGKAERRLLALASKERLRRILSRMLDEKEFLSPHGIRSCVARGSRSKLTCGSMSRYHLEHPYFMHVNGEEFMVQYWPGDSKSSCVPFAAYGRP
jgi:hypothetical protein